MRRALESRDGLTSYAVTSVEDLDLPALLPMLEDAWRASYLHQARQAFDEAFLRWLLNDEVWVATLLCTSAGPPVGFELSLERTLYCGEHAFRAYYASLLTVSPAYRRRGLGRRLLESLHHIVFTERGADLIFSSFHGGHSGLPAVQDTYDRIPGWGLLCFHTGTVWGRRLTPGSPSTGSPSRLLRAARLVCPAGTDVLIPVPVPPDRAPALWAVPSMKALNESLRMTYGVAFGVDGSFRTQYLSPRADRAGTFWYENGAASCAVSFNMTRVVTATRTLGVVGFIQAVHASGCTPLQLREVLEHICQFFQRHDCYGATIVDYGVLPHEALYAAGFRPTVDRRTFAVRGPRASLEPFAAVAPPYFLDVG